MTKKDTEFEENLHFLLHEKKFDDVLDALKNPEKDAYISENVWNLIDLVCLTVKTESLLKTDADVVSCKKILMWLVDRGNPKEVLVSLLEQADSFKDHEFFCLLLEPLQCTLQRAPGKRGKTLQWVLSSLNAHIETLQEPRDLDLQGKEKLLLDADPAVQDVSYVLSGYLTFIEAFVDEVSFENMKKEENQYFSRVCHQQEILHRYILKLFYRPLLYHDLHMPCDSRPKSTVQAVCEGFVRCLSKICRNVFNLFKYDTLYNGEDKNSSETDIDEDDVVYSLAFANLSYLIFVENIALDFRPFVYSHLFLFMKNLRHIILLLRSEKNLVLFKGLHLAETLLSGLDSEQLDYDCMELEVFTEFPRLLLNIAIFSKFETHRKLALKLFRSYISKCNYKGRYHLIMQVLSTINNSNAEGLVINLYKDYLHEALNGKTSANYFLGKNFNVFVKKIFNLSDGVETDIVENSDRIITSLNFLRYVLLRDKREINSTGVWDLKAYISDHFIAPLITGLDMSRAHYKQMMVDVLNEKKSQKSLNTTVTCEQTVLPNVPADMHRQVFSRAMTTFDVIQSILSRVQELIDLATGK